MKTKITKKMVAFGMVMTMLFSMALVASAATKTMYCYQYPVYCTSSKTTSKVTGTTGFNTSVGGTQRVSVTVNSVIKYTDGTGRTKAGTPSKGQSTVTVSKTYTCPSSFVVIQGTTTHTATCSGDTEQCKLTV